MQAIKDMIVALVRNQRHEGTLESQGLAKFRRTNPHNFLEDMIQKKAKLWIKEMEKIFRVMNCVDNQKVNYVVFMLI